MERSYIIYQLIDFLDIVNPQISRTKVSKLVKDSNGLLSESDIKQYLSFMEDQGMIYCQSSKKGHDVTRFWVTLKGYQFCKESVYPCNQTELEKSFVLCRLLNYFDNTNSDLTVLGIAQYFSQMGIDSSVENIGSYISYLKEEDLISEIKDKNSVEGTSLENMWVTYKGYHFLRLLSD